MSPNVIRSARVSAIRPAYRCTREEPRLTGAGLESRAICVSVEGGRQVLEPLSPFCTRRTAALAGPPRLPSRLHLAMKLAAAHQPAGDVGRLQERALRWPMGG
jgi:hypothetical protein